MNIVEHVYNLAKRGDRPRAFFKNKLYVGITTNQKSSITGNYIRELRAHAFRGKPYNQFEFDSIYESADIYLLVKEAIELEAKANGRDVVEQSGHIYQIPRWIHTARTTA